MEDRIDTHLHFFTAGAEREVEESAFLAPRFENATILTLLKEHPEYDNAAFHEIVKGLRDARLPVMPHWVEPIYCASIAESEDEINRFVLLAIDGSGLTPSNEQVRRLAGLFPGAIIPATSVNPKKEGAVKELEKELSEVLKLGGDLRPVVKLHPLLQGFLPVQVNEDFYRAMADFGAVLDIHTGVFQSGPSKYASGEPDKFDIYASDPMQLRGVIERFPRINFILVHMGTPDYAVNEYWKERGIKIEHFEHALELMRQCPNVYGDIGGLMWEGREGKNNYDGMDTRGYDFGKRSEWAFARLRSCIMDQDMRAKYDQAVKLRGKIVFGTDYPITDHPNKELRRQMGVLGFNPAINSKAVLRR